MEVKDKSELILCACGCGLTRLRYDRNCREHRFIGGHNNRGKHGLKGGNQITNGYMYILSLDHHFKDSKGYVKRSRLTYEKYHKCILLPWAIIHHKDHNKLNDSIDNLEAMTGSQHKRLHGLENSHIAKHIKERKYVYNQFGIFRIKKRN